MAMLATVLGLTLLVAPKGPAQTLFSDPNTGYRFVIPSNWTVENKKVRTNFFIPMGKEKRAARIELLDTNFRQSVETWQELQAQVAREGGNRLDRQWTEEFLGVPMLMTRVTTKAKGVETHLTVALFYTATDKKMLFRMVTPTAYSADVERMWRESMLTLTPIGGKLPQAESPDRPVVPPDKKTRKKGREDTVTVPIENTPEQPKKPVVLTAQPSAELKIAKDAQPFSATAAGRAMRLWVPAGWKITVNTDGTFSATTNALKSPVTLSVLSPLDSPGAERQLISGPAKSLAEFSKATREDRPIRRNAANQMVRSMVRRGDVNGISTVELYATGEGADSYWYAVYRSAAGPTAEADLRLIARLLDTLAVEQVKS